MSLTIEKPITLDLLDTKKAPALSSTSDVPVIETKPDASPEKPENKESKPAPEEKKPEAKAEEKPAAAPAKDAKTEVEAESAEGLEQPESTSASDKPKPAKGVQKRLDELTRNWREAEQREARLLALLEEKAKPQVEAREVKEPAKPKREEFGDDASYTAALVEHAAAHAEWRVTQRIEAERKAEQEKQEKASIAEQSRKVQEAYAARVEKFKESHSDYSEVAESPDVQISVPMAHAIAHSEDGPAIAYFLGSNPDEAKRISSLPPTVQLMELGLIVASLKAPAPSKPVSAAPPPPKPLKSASEAAPSTDPESESMEAYAARRKKEWAKEGRFGTRH